MNSWRTCCRCRRLAINIQSRHSRRIVPTNRSATAFAFGALTGVWSTRIPSALNTVSKRARELAVVVTDQELQGPVAFGEREHEAPGLLRCPGTVGVLAHAGKAHTPGEGCIPVSNGRRTTSISRSQGSSKDSIDWTDCPATPHRSLCEYPVWFL